MDSSLLYANYSEELLNHSISITDNSVPSMNYVANYVNSSDIVYATSLWLTVAYGVVTVPAFACNALVILAVALTPKLHTAMNIYVVNLAVSDLLVVGLECPLVIIQFLFDSGSIISRNFCLVAFCFNTFAGASSVITLLALSVERYCMVMHPLQARSLSHHAKDRAMCIVLFSWSLTILMHLGQCFLYGSIQEVKMFGETGDVLHSRSFCLSALDDELAPWEAHLYAASVFLMIYGSTFLITLVLYIKIIVYLCRRNTLELRAPVNGSPRGKKSSNHVAQVATKNTIRIFTFSVMSYFCCYSVYFYVNLYFVYFGLLPNSGLFLMAIANLLGALNSLINPILSTLFVHQFRQTIRKIVICAHPWRESNTSANRRSALFVASVSSKRNDSSTRESFATTRQRSETLPCTSPTHNEPKTRGEARCSSTITL